MSQFISCLIVTHVVLLYQLDEMLAHQPSPSISGLVNVIVVVSENKDRREVKDISEHARRHVPNTPPLQDRD